MGEKLKKAKGTFSGGALVLLILSLFGKFEFNLALRITMFGLVLFYVADILIKRKNGEVLDMTDIFMFGILFIGGILL